MVTKWGLISLGRHSDIKIAPAINQASGAGFAAVFSRDMATAEAFAEKHGVDAAYDSLDAMRAADLVLVNAGTATLEAMLLKKPMVMSYRLGKLTYALVSRLVQTPFFALPNILAGTALVPEFIQDEATPEKLAEAVLKQLGGESDALLQSFAGLHKSLRRKGGERAAEAVLALCDARRRDGRKDGPSVST